MIDKTLHRKRKIKQTEPH